MKLTRLLLALPLVGILVGVAYVGQAPPPAGARMTTAAQKFLATLQPDQKAVCAFAFDSPERINWHFVPLQNADKQPTRKGLRLEKMTAEQKAAALDLLRAGTSGDGYTKATTIMSLENILKELEAGKGPVRNPGWYFFTVFGTPSKMGKWGWRVEGHHLSLNFTLDGDKVVSSTPAFFGANPATVMEGPRKGLRTLPQAEDLARELFRSLDKDQRAAALQKKPFGEPAALKAAAGVGEPKGLPASKMHEKQRHLLEQLIEAYTDRMPPDVGALQLKEVKDAGIDRVYFAWTGGADAGEPHTYRVQGPTFVIEFLDVQKDSGGNPANHIHSCWRNIHGDFGIRSE